jgi:hypothetical protein
LTISTNNIYFYYKINNTKPIIEKDLSMNRIFLVVCLHITILSFGSQELPQQNAESDHVLETKAQICALLDQASSGVNGVKNLIADYLLPQDWKLINRLPITQAHHLTPVVNGEDQYYSTFAAGSNNGVTLFQVYNEKDVSIQANIPLPDQYKACKVKSSWSNLQNVITHFDNGDCLIYNLAGNGDSKKRIEKIENVKFALLASERSLITIEKNNSCKIWKITPNKIELYTECNIDHPIHALHALSNNRFIIATDQSIILCDIPTKQGRDPQISTQYFQTTQPISSAVFSPNGKHLILGLTNGTIMLINRNQTFSVEKVLATPKILLSHFSSSEHTGPVHALACSNKYIASAGKDNIVKIFKIRPDRTFENVQAIEGKNGTALAFSKNNNYLTIGSAQGVYIFQNIKNDDSCEAASFTGATGFTGPAGFTGGTGNIGARGLAE